jgi:hypothetical protein
MANAWDERKKGVEEEYFRRQEQELPEKTHRRIAAGEREQRKAAAVMHCPKGGENLEEITFQGVQVVAVAGVREYGWTSVNSSA